MRSEIIKPFKSLGGLSEKMSKNKEHEPDHTIVLDLEMCRVHLDWYKKTGLNTEIIQIGAVLLDRNGNIQSRFKSNVCPVYGKISGHVKDLTGITKQDIVGAPSLAKVLKAFLAWVPEGKVRMVSWGLSDRIQFEVECKIKNIKTNGKLNEMFAGWTDLQKEYLRRTKLSTQISLKGALAISGIEPEGRFHDALDDAVNTARLFQMLSSGANLIADEYLFSERKKKEESQNPVKPAADIRKQETDRFLRVDYENAGKNLIVFYGDQLDPLPQDLFMLWKKIVSHGCKTYLNASVGSSDVPCHKTLVYDEERNAYMSSDDRCEDTEYLAYFPFNTFIGLSLYHDRHFGKDMFFIIMATGGNGAREDFLVADMMAVEAEVWFENEYRRWIKVRKKNPDRFQHH